MSWTVILEDENKEEIESISSEFIIKSFDSIVKSDEFRLIRYLDPYGDTGFNNLQITDLIVDLEKVRKLEPDNKLVGEIILLAQKCLSQPHLYLTFYGD